jgi:hypothetical protein
VSEQLQKRYGSLSEIKREFFPRAWEEEQLEELRRAREDREAMEAELATPSSNQSKETL